MHNPRGSVGAGVPGLAGLEAGQVADAFSDLIGRMKTAGGASQQALLEFLVSIPTLTCVHMIYMYTIHSSIPVQVTWAQPLITPVACQLPAWFVCGYA
jgi:hypothetical protein